MRFCNLHALPVLGAVLLLTVPAAAQPELSYGEYRAIAETAARLQHCAMFEPLEGEAGMYLAVGDRFGKLNVYLLAGERQHERVWESRQLDGNADEVLVADLDGNGLDDHLVCRTQRRIYVFKLGDDFFNTWESQPNDFAEIRAFTVADVDNDPAQEIVLIANGKLHYIDGESYVREFTSLNDYEATRMRCGDVDGDGRAEIVLNTGAVIDSSSGEIKWQDEVFGTRLELLDFDGDGILEILTEGEGTVLRVWEVDHKQEKRF